MDTSINSRAAPSFLSRWAVLAIIIIWLAAVNAMAPARIAELRKETIGMFYHGFDNYMEIAFPEDEVARPHHLVNDPANSDS